MKKLFPLIIWGGLFFFIGWIAGQSNINKKLDQLSDQLNKEQISLIDRKMADAGSVYGTIRLLDTGKSKDAIYLLSLQQGGDILMINNLLPSAAEHSRKTATNLFEMIARNYVDHISDYRGKLTPTDTNLVEEVKSSEKKVELILKNYK